jgi:hypothetical protein
MRVKSEERREGEMKNVVNYIRGKDMRGEENIYVSNCGDRGDRMYNERTEC